MLSLLLLATPAGAAKGSDWQHALKVAQMLRTSRPETPVVLLLGGSCARESTVSDKDWTANLAQAGGSPVVAYNLGSRNQTFEQELALVKALPKTPMLVFVGVNRGRFTSAPANAPISTAPVSTKGTYTQHSYSHRRIKTPERKQEVVTYWMRTRYPVFARRLDANLGRLDELIRACKERGFHPVILELPRNMEVIGDAFDAPIRQYQEGCKAIADRHAVPFVDFVDAAGLRNEDFFDLDHLVEPGRAKFQHHLVDETVGLLARFELSTAKDGRTAGSRPAVITRARPILAPVGVAALLGVALAVQRRRTVVRRRRRRRLVRRQASKAGSPGGRQQTPPAPRTGQERRRPRSRPRS